MLLGIFSTDKIFALGPQHFVSFIFMQENKLTEVLNVKDFK